MQTPPFGDMVSFAVKWTCAFLVAWLVMLITLGIVLLMVLLIGSVLI